MKYETTQDKIKISEKLLKSIKYSYLKVNFILQIIKLIIKYLNLIIIDI